MDLFYEKKIEQALDGRRGKHIQRKKRTEKEKREIIKVGGKISRLTLQVFNYTCKK